MLQPGSVTPVAQRGDAVFYNLLQRIWAPKKEEKQSAQLSQWGIAAAASSWHLGIDGALFIWEIE